MTDKSSRRSGPAGASTMPSGPASPTANLTRTGVIYTRPDGIQAMIEPAEFTGRSTRVAQLWRTPSHLITHPACLVGTKSVPAEKPVRYMPRQVVILNEISPDGSSKP